MPALDGSFSLFQPVDLLRQMCLRFRLARASITLA
jgi:hypothetical protein